jgi:hypothetical protein
VGVSDETFEQHSKFPHASILIGVALFAWGAAIELHYGRCGFMPLDQSIIFDGGYRIFSGQLPFRDFLTPTGIFPSLIQAFVFRAFGVTWFSYVLHSAVANGLFSVLAFVFLRQFALPRTAAAWWAALSAVVFYPPIGVPYSDHHAFLCGLAALVAAMASIRAAEDREALAASALVIPLLAAGFLSKPNPGVFLLPTAIVPLLAKSTRRQVGNLIGLFLGTLAVLCTAAYYRLRYVHSLATVKTYGWDLPAGTGRLRLQALWRTGAYARSLIQPIRDSWPIASLALAAIVGTWLALSGGHDERLTAFLSLALLAVTLAYTVLTFRNPATGVSFGFIACGLGHAGLYGIRNRDSAGRLAGPLGLTTLLLVVVSGAEAMRFNRQVNVTRAAIGLGFDRRAPSPLLPAALGYLRWATPDFVDYGAADLSAIVRYFQSHPGNFFLIGDSSILYGITGRPSTSPVLWFHPNLTLPYVGMTATSTFEEQLLRHLHGRDVRYIVLEGKMTQMGVSLASFPALAAEVGARKCGEDDFGGFRIVSLCSPL